jgi:hypothetical protein
VSLYLYGRPIGPCPHIAPTRVGAVGDVTSAIQGGQAAIGAGQNLFEGSWSAAGGTASKAADLQAIGAVGIALAKGLNNSVINAVVGAAESALGGMAAGAAIGSIIPGLGTVVGALIGAFIGAISDVFAGGVPNIPPHDTRKHMSTKLVFPFEPQWSTGTNSAWVHPAGSTDQTKNVALRLAMVDDHGAQNGLAAQDDDWNQISTMLGGDDKATKAFNKYLRWYGMAQNAYGPLRYTNTYPWLDSHGLTAQVDPLLPNIGTYLPEPAANGGPGPLSGDGWGINDIRYAIAELAALDATPEEALHYMLSMGWLWRQGERIDHSNTAIPSDFHRILGRMQDDMKKEPVAINWGALGGLLGRLQVVPPPPPPVLNPSIFGKLNLAPLVPAIVKATPRQQWVVYYLSQVHGSG